MQMLLFIDVFEHFVQDIGTDQVTNNRKVIRGIIIVFEHQIAANINTDCSKQMADQ